MHFLCLNRCNPARGDFDRSCFPIRRGKRPSRCVSFVRSFPVCQGSKREQREQISNITSYIDGSMIYGSTDFVASRVRKGKCKQNYNILTSTVRDTRTCQPNFSIENQLPEKRYAKYWISLLKFMKQQFNLFEKHEKRSRNYFSKKAFIMMSINTHVPTGVYSLKSRLGRPEQCVKSVQSQQQKSQNDVILVCLLLTLNRFHTLIWCFQSWL